jgi:hypothetical protein
MCDHPGTTDSRPHESAGKRRNQRPRQGQPTAERHTRAYRVRALAPIPPWAPTIGYGPRLGNQKAIVAVGNSVLIAMNLLLADPDAASDQRASPMSALT